MPRLNPEQERQFVLDTKSFLLAQRFRIDGNVLDWLNVKDGTKAHRANLKHFAWSLGDGRLVFDESSERAIRLLDEAGAVDTFDEVGEVDEDQEIVGDADAQAALRSIAVDLIARSVPLPPRLGAFVAGILKGRKVKAQPGQRSSKYVLRDHVIAWAVSRLVALPHQLSVPQAARIVDDALGEINKPLGAARVGKIFAAWFDSVSDLGEISID